MRLIAFAVALLFAAPVIAEVRSASPTRIEVSNSVQVAAAPDMVWQALIKPNRWWSSDHSWSGDARNFYLSAQGGGCFCEQLPDVKGSVEHARVILARPGKELRMIGALGPLQSMAVIGNLHVVLKPSDGGTEVTMSYIVAGAIDGDAAQLAPLVDGVLAQQLTGLKTYAEAPAQ